VIARVIEPGRFDFGNRPTTSAYDVSIASRSSSSVTADPIRKVFQP